MFPPTGIETTLEFNDEHYHERFDADASCRTDAAGSADGRREQAQRIRMCFYTRIDRDVTDSNIKNSRSANLHVGKKSSPDRCPEQSSRGAARPV